MEAPLQAHHAVQHALPPRVPGFAPFRDPRLMPQCLPPLARPVSGKVRSHHSMSLLGACVSNKLGSDANVFPIAPMELDPASIPPIAGWARGGEHEKKGEDEASSSSRTPRLRTAARSKSNKLKSKDDASESSAECFICMETISRMPTSPSGRSVRKAFGNLWICTMCVADRELGPLKTVRKPMPERRMVVDTSDPEASDLQRPAARQGAPHSLTRCQSAPQRKSESAAAPTLAPAPERSAAVEAVAMAHHRPITRRHRRMRCRSASNMERQQAPSEPTKAAGGGRFVEKTGGLMVQLGLAAKKVPVAWLGRFDRYLCGDGSSQNAAGNGKEFKAEVGNTNAGSDAQRHTEAPSALQPLDVKPACALQAYFDAKDAGVAMPHRKLLPPLWIEATAQAFSNGRKPTPLWLMEALLDPISP